jgi:hypothetical protein
METLSYCFQNNLPNSYVYHESSGSKQLLSVALPRLLLSTVSRLSVSHTASYIMGRGGEGTPVEHYYNAPWLTGL